MPGDGDNSELVNQLILQDPTQPGPGKAVVEGVIVAFFWSPDSRRLLILCLKLKLQVKPHRYQPRTPH